MMRRHLLALLLAGLPWTPAPHYAITPSFSAPLTSSLVPTRGGVTATFSRADATTCATVLAYCSTCNAADGLRLITVPAGEARFYGARRVSAGVWSDYFADGSLIPIATRLGYLSEGSRANLILQSETLQTTWTPTRASVSTNTTTAPDANVTADSLIEDTTVGSNSHFIKQTITKAASAIAYTMSVYAKSNGRRYILYAEDGTDTNGAFVTFDLAGGQIGTAAVGVGTPFTSLSATMTALPNGWYRCTLSFTTNTTTSLVFHNGLDNGTGTGASSPTYHGDGTSGVYLWGAQLEQASFASTYIATTTAAVTRAADALTYPSAGIVSNTTGSAYAEWQIPKLTVGNHNILGAASQQRQFLHIVDTSTVQFYDGTNVNQWAVSAFSDAVVYRSAASWSGTTCSAYVNGAIASPATKTFDGNLDVTPSVGIGYDNNTEHPYGTIRNVRLYTRALTAAQVAAIQAAQ